MNLVYICKLFEIKDLAITIGVREISAVGWGRFDLCPKNKSGINGFVG
jgi:hypothetical protein